MAQQNERVQSEAVLDTENGAGASGQSDWDGKRGLVKNKEIDTFNVYEMRLGMLFVKIQFDWYGSGRISVSIDNHFGHAIFMLFDPVTLEEDCEAEDRQKERDNRERLNEWVDSIGPELCKEQIDRAWNRDI